MHDGAGRRDRLCLHRAARAARDAARAALQQEIGARSRHRDRASERTLCHEGQMMTVERKPVAYDGLHGWLKALEVAGEVKPIDAEVDWNIELGTIARLLQGPATGPSVLFNNIKDYNKPSSRCKKVFTGALANYRRIAMMMGLPPETHPRELVKLGRNILGGTIAPKVVATWPVKGRHLKGDAVDLYEFPAPFWNRLDGGRYMQTYGACVTKDPETGIMNAGVYRGMIADKTHMPILMWRAQHIG